MSYLATLKKNLIHQDSETNQTIHSHNYLQSILHIMLVMVTGEGNSNPLQSSCLKNSLDREAWRATVNGVAKDRTQLSAWAHMHAETPLTGNGMKETHHKITIQNSRGHYGRILDLCSICELLKKYKLNKINTALKINHAFLSS